MEYQYLKLEMLLSVSIWRNHNDPLLLTGGGCLITLNLSFDKLRIFLVVKGICLLLAFAFRRVAWFDLYGIHVW